MTVRSVGRRKKGARAGGRDIVFVDGETGEVFGENYDLTVELERKLYFNPALDRWMVPPVRGVTIICQKSFKEE